MLGRMLAVAMAAPLVGRLPLSRLEAVLEPRRVPVPRTAPDGGAERIVWLVDAAIHVGTPLVRPGCLTRGLTSFWFLRRAGHQVSLVFGIDAAHGSATAHCWLETGNQPRFERTDPRTIFSAIASIPSRA